MWESSEKQGTTRGKGPIKSGGRLKTQLCTRSNANFEGGERKRAREKKKKKNKKKKEKCPGGKKEDDKKKREQEW